MAATLLHLFSFILSIYLVNGQAWSGCYTCANCTATLYDARACTSTVSVNLIGNIVGVVLYAPHNNETGAYLIINTGTTIKYNISNLTVYTQKDSAGIIFNCGGSVCKNNYIDISEDGFFTDNSCTCTDTTLITAAPTKSPTDNPTTATPTNMPTTAEPTTKNPTTSQPTTATPTTANPSTTPTTTNPTSATPTTATPTTGQPSSSSPTTANPTTSTPTTSNPTSAVPTTAQPTTGNPTTNNPTTSNPTTNVPTTQYPTTRNPTTWNPTTRNPTNNVVISTNGSNTSSSTPESVEGDNCEKMNVYFTFIVIILVSLYYND